MTYFFPYIFFEVIVNFLNSQRFLPVTSAGEHRHTLLQLPLPEWGPRAGGWMAMFALGGLDLGGASYPICLPLCFWGHLEKNRVWSDGLHVGMGYTTEVKGLVLHWGGVLEEAPSFSGCFWTADLSQPQLLCCLQKYSGGIWALNSPTYTLPGGYTLSDLP